MTSDDARKNLPRATHKGKIGDVEVYVLEDGRCVLSKRSAAAALLSGARASDFDRFLERLSNRNKALRAAPHFEFLTTDNRIALAVDDETFASVIEACVEGMIKNTLDPKQYHIAERAYDLQKSYSRIGLRAHILAVSGVEPRTVVQVIGCFAERVLRRDKRDWERRFSSEFIAAVCQVYGWQQTGNRVPQQMAAVFDKLYRLILGKEARQRLRERCPNPRHGNNQHQWLCDELDHEFPAITSGITYIARRSGRSVKYFWRQVEEFLGVVPVQTEMPLRIVGEKRKAS
jgi:hypothetical protein